MASNVIQGPWQAVDAPTIALHPFAQYHGVTIRTVHRWIEKGMPGVEKRNDGIWFNLVHANPWVEQQRTAA